MNPSAAPPLPPGPETIHFDLGNGCNTDCVTCWDHSPLLSRPRDAAWKAVRADTAALLRVVDAARAAGTLRSAIVSAMGEPLLHPGAPAFLAELKARGLHVTLITNLLHPSADRLAATGVDALLAGLHAATEETYRAFHPTLPGGAWAAVRARLAARAAAGFGDKHVHVICRVNAHELPAMIEQGAELSAARVNFKLASLARGTERVDLSAAERARLAAEGIPAARARAAALGVRHNLDSLAAQLASPPGATAPIARTGCHMGDRYARIDARGTVYFCCNTETALGVLPDGRGFRELWNGPEWNALRARLAAFDFLPGCARCGKFEQNAKIAAKRRAAGRDGA